MPFLRRDYFSLSPRGGKSSLRATARSVAIQKNNKKCYKLAFFNWIPLQARGDDNWKIDPCGQCPPWLGNEVQLKIHYL
ncbi:hypothetical protein RBEAN4_0058 [Rickettsia bellii str. RML An4]|uniref:Uncharacterized protein n=1 Tax=Rickettsia bellii str. RML An4 TaxID=1359193 RepID=A0A0F3QAA6_RICBE|nr:hypothetical protein RBEAN4_0058 [Rickettsia bellii str. RML An4]